MDPTGPTSSPPVLPYAAPPRRNARPFHGTFVAISAACLGLYSATMLFCGIIEFVHLVHNRPWNFWIHFLEALLFLLIGLFCAWVTFRACRTAWRLFKGR